MSAPWNALAHPFAFPDLAGRRVLLLGLGGGCDIILAWLLAQLDPFRAGTALYANTKQASSRDLVPLGTYLARVPEALLRPLPRKGHGTARIDQAVPRGPEGCPWIVRLPADSDKDAAVAAELRAQRFDAVFGIDTGGDSLFDGGEGSEGTDHRDVRMWKVARALGVPATLLVAAPGSDGDVPGHVLTARIADLHARGLYRGCLSLAPLLPALYDLLDEIGPNLEAHRTPNIIRAAAEGRLDEDAPGMVRVPRGRRPVVPRDWLLHVLAFTDTEGAGA